MDGLKVKVGVLLAKFVQGSVSDALLVRGALLASHVIFVAVGGTL